MREKLKAKLPLGKTVRSGKDMMMDGSDREKAEKFADMILRPAGLQRPDKSQVFRFLAGQMETGLEEAAYAAWEKENFECINGDTVIYGEYYPVENAAGCAVLVHGFAQNRYILIPQQKLFRELGFDTVLFDQRAFGESREKYCTFGMEEARDVACVADRVRAKCGENARIVVLGVSMGAASSMRALAYTENIDYLVEDCGFAEIEDVVDDLYKSMNGREHNPLAREAFVRKAAKIGIDMRRNKPIEAVRNSDTPICIFHGTADSIIRAEHAGRLYEACRNPMSRMELFEGKEHALCVTDAGRYKAVLREFLQ